MMWILVALTATDEITTSLLLEKTSVRFLYKNKSIIILRTTDLPNCLIFSVNEVPNGRICNNLSQKKPGHIDPALVH